MNSDRIFRNELPQTDSSGRRNRRPVEQRKDWGFTDHYRRMMQRFPKKEQEEI